MKRKAEPKPAARRRTAEETKEQILDAAEELFASGGLEGVTVREVRAKAGVTCRARRRARCANSWWTAGESNP